MTIHRNRLIVVIKDAAETVAQPIGPGHNLSSILKKSTPDCPPVGRRGIAICHTLRETNDIGGQRLRA
jgi:hypothetical protein